MSKEKVENIDSEEKEVENLETQADKIVDESKEESENGEESKEEVDEVASLKAEIEALKDKHLRLYSEFENYRRRTAKERLELIKTATEDLMLELLPILDDFERAKISVEKDKSGKLDEGFELIHQKINRVLKNKGLEPMKDKEGTVFDAEVHEAISQIPAPSKKLKGKIVDVIERGYKLNDKVIRFAKVVIGS